jgi:hypothetical protein
MNFFNLFPKALARELAEVCANLTAIKKLGHNEEDDYDFLRIVDVCDALKAELFRRGILFLPTDLEQTHEFIRNPEGEVVERCIVRTAFTVIRGDKRLELGTSFGSAQNRADKALAVAQTAAFKAWLKRLTMTYGVDEDPEASPHTEAKPEESASSREAVRIAAYQRRALNAAIGASGISYDRLSEDFSRIMGFPIQAAEVADLQEKDFEVVMKWLLAQGAKGQQAPPGKLKKGRPYEPQPASPFPITRQAESS